MAVVGNFYFFYFSPINVGISRLESERGGSICLLNNKIIDACKLSCWSRTLGSKGTRSCMHLTANHVSFHLSFTERFPRHCTVMRPLINLKFWISILSLQCVVWCPRNTYHPDIVRRSLWNHMPQHSPRPSCIRSLHFRRCAGAY